jgi:heterotetrameric sarcosine oxidase gamma subunit
VADRVTLEPLEIGVGWNLRGDPRAPAFVAASERTLGLALPTQPGASASAADAGQGRQLAPLLLSLGPTSWLFVATSPASLPDFEPARKAINAAAGALFDVSASHVGWSITGTHAARVLNCACPLDFDPRSFAVGHCAQSLLGHVAATFYRPAASTFIVMVSRSFAAGVKRDLQTFADQTSTITHAGA